MNALFLSLALLGHPTVTDTTIIGHGDQTPRFAPHYQNVLVVPAETTVTLPPVSNFDAIEVSGTLRVSREHDTLCRAIHVTVLPGGVLDLGTEADTIPAERKVELLFRDVALRTGTVQSPDIDPHQIGNGLIVFGSVTMHGAKKEHFVYHAADIPAGAISVTLPGIPEGWRVGDELMIPDTRQPWYTNPSLTGIPEEPVRMESAVTIAAINGNTITFSKPLDFAHNVILKPSGEVAGFPLIANKTRNVILRSENPSGTRGHFIVLEMGHSDCRYYANIGMGRTRAVPLHSTSLTGSANDQIGTNQIARYADHLHHVHGHADHDGLTAIRIGNVLDGLSYTPDGAKWGWVQHGTHDVLVSDCICTRYSGAGFITEDGYETRGQYLRNLAAYIHGARGDGKGHFLDGNPGAEGAGFWPHSMAQMTFEDNVAVNCNIGYVPFYIGQVTGRLVPSEPGGENDTLIDPTQAVPLSFKNNTAIANRSFGYEPWVNPEFQVHGFRSLNNGVWQVKSGTDMPGSITFTDLLSVCQPGKGASGVSTSAAYIGKITLDNCEIVGANVGVKEARATARFSNCTFQNIIDIDWWDFRPERGRIESPLFKTLPGKVARLRLGQNFQWHHGDPTQDWKTVPAWGPNDGKRFVVTDWNRQGQDYLLFENYQKASNDALPAKGYNGLYCPELGLSNQQCWDKYGVAWNGGIIKDADAIELPGLLYGVAKAGLDYYPLPQSRAVLQQPNMLEPFDPASTDRLHLTLTGEPVPGVVVCSQVNDGPIDRHRPDGYDPPGFSRIARATTPGTYTVKTWLEDATGQKVAGSDGVYRYFIGEPSEPPVDPEPDPDPMPDPDPPADPTIAELKARIEQLEREVLSLLARIVDLENFRRDIKAAGE